MNWVLLGLIGVGAYMVLRPEKKRRRKRSRPWIGVLYGSRTKAEAEKRARRIKRDWPITRVVPDPSGGWVVEGRE